MSGRARVAVIGGGAAGIAAAHSLASDGKHEVTLFEAEPRLGGHAHTVMVDDGRGGTVGVDTAFLIYNARHYPAFVALLRELGVEGDTAAAEMSTSFIDEDRQVRYALGRGRGLGALFAPPTAALRPRHWRLLTELLVFRRRAAADVALDRIGPTVTLGTYLASYSELFRECFVVPLAAAIWSLPDDLVLQYPARSILEFFRNHQLLGGDSGDAWRTFPRGSRTYVDAFAARFPGRLRLGTRVDEVRRDTVDTRRGPVTIVAEGTREVFDAVVLATHADVSLRLLADTTDDERALLSPWRYHPNTVILHGDERWVPEARLRSSWNVVHRDGRRVVTYDLNRVQSLASARSYFLTLGDVPVDPAREVARFVYRHPIFSAASVATQPALRRHDGDRRTYFCGSYHGHGFHEDAVASARLAVRSLDRQLAAVQPVDDGASVTSGRATVTVRPPEAVWAKASVPS